MLKAFRLFRVRFAFLCLLLGVIGPVLHAQETALGRQLSRLDLGVSGIGQFSKNTTGTNYLNQTLTQSPSNTLGALVTVRYTKSPLVGFEGNYSYARYTENYSQYIIGGAQTNASEYSLGYVAHTPLLFGVQPFVGVGAGSIAFRPTPNGGQGLKAQARAAYYYDAGVENPIFSSHFGIRAQFRQVFFLAPDFGQNYLTTKQRSFTLEPGIGIFLKF